MGEAFEAYDAEMRVLSEMSPVAARELMVRAEETRLEERCAMLVSTLEPIQQLEEKQCARPSTPVLGKSHQGLPPGGLLGTSLPGLCPASKMTAVSGSLDEAMEELSEGCMS